VLTGQVHRKDLGKWSESQNACVWPRPPDGAVRGHAFGANPLTSGRIIHATGWVETASKGVGARDP
jgi:hypothetical protein